MSRPDCIEWQKARSKDGYGVFSKGGRPPKGTTMLAHREAWTKERGPISKGMWVLHKCDNPPCVNIDHLFLGTQKDNNQDMWRKGRGVSHNKLKTHCKRGHAFTEENTYLRPGGRECRACWKEGKL
jgi:hypothetical protein